VVMLLRTYGVCVCVFLCCCCNISVGVIVIRVTDARGHVAVVGIVVGVDGIAVGTDGIVWYDVDMHDGVNVGVGEIGVSCMYGCDVVMSDVGIGGVVDGGCGDGGIGVGGGGCGCGYFGAGVGVGVGDISGTWVVGVSVRWL